jgi:hypothetical protein
MLAEEEKMQKYKYYIVYYLSIPAVQDTVTIWNFNDSWLIFLKRVRRTET